MKRIDYEYKASKGMFMALVGRAEHNETGLRSHAGLIETLNCFNANLYSSRRPTKFTTSNSCT